MRSRIVLGLCLLLGLAWAPAASASIFVTFGDDGAVDSLTGGVHKVIINSGTPQPVPIYIRADAGETLSLALFANAQIGTGTTFFQGPSPTGGFDTSLAGTIWLTDATAESIPLPMIPTAADAKKGNIQIINGPAFGPGVPIPIPVTNALLGNFLLDTSASGNLLTNPTTLSFNLTTLQTGPPGGTPGLSSVLVTGTVTPEPGAFALGIMACVGGLLIYRRKRQRA